MPRKRKTISKKIRFEVFKRDKFTCQYCGRQAPEVVLVIDHIHPVSKGGEDAMLNYATSCEGCNSGKGARTLDDQTVLAKQRAEVERLAERREQVEMMLQWHRNLESERKFERDALATRWSELVDPFHLTETGLKTAEKYLRSFSLTDLLAAMDIAVSQYVQRNANGEPTSETVNQAWSKIPGIARLSKLPSDERELYYVRGICRKRFSYCDEADCIQTLREAMWSGVDIDSLKNIAKTARNWTQWSEWMTQVIDEVGSQRASS